MRVVIIGAGFGGLSAAAYLANAGHEVDVYEKNSFPGGRVRTEYNEGFRFETGPSWYTMPDVFEEFFVDFGYTPTDFYDLKKLVPSYQLFEQDDAFAVHPHRAASMDFEQREKGAGARLARLLDEVESEYQMARRDVIPLSGLSRTSYMNRTVIWMLANPKLLGSFHNRMSRVVHHPMLQHALEFPAMFLGGSPHNIPAAYGLIGSALFTQGVWHPHGGFSSIAAAVERVATDQGARIFYNAPVEKISIQNGTTSGVRIGGELQKADAVIANADYHYVDTHLVAPKYRIYTESEWEAKTVSPSMVIGKIGVKQRLDLEHHSLFFDADWDEHFEDIFDNHVKNQRPLFFVSTPSKTDASFAPDGHDALSIHIPVSGRADITQADADELVDLAIKRIEARVGSFQEAIVFRQVYAPAYFQETFHAFKGNTYGLTHIGEQSGPLRPAIRSPNVDNLYFVGHYTNPGAGMPFVLLSGKVVAKTLS